MGKITEKRTNKSAKKILRAIAVIIGGFITAYGLEAVLIPNNVSDGGVTGLSIVGYTQTRSVVLQHWRC